MINSSFIYLMLWHIRVGRRQNSKWNFHNFLFVIDGRTGADDGIRIRRSPVADTINENYGGLPFDSIPAGRLTIITWMDGNSIPQKVLARLPNPGRRVC